MKKITREILKQTSHSEGRREFLKYVAMGAAGLSLTAFSAEPDRQTRKKPERRTREEKLRQISSNSYAVNQLFKRQASMEYEAGGDPVEGTLKLMNDVVEALV